MPGASRQALKSPREVRNALAYVLLNARKHWKERYGVAPLSRVNEASSGRWFGVAQSVEGIGGWGCRSRGRAGQGLAFQEGLAALGVGGSR